MGLIIKSIIAFCIGLGAITAAQHLWVSSMMQRVRTASATTPLPQTQFKPVMAVDPDKMRNAIMPPVPQIDTKRYQALGVLSAQRQIDIQVRNAQSAVPRMPSIPGVRR
jgi:hypothetical protein